MASKPRNFLCETSVVFDLFLPSEVRGSAANFAGLQKTVMEAEARSRGQESRCRDVKCDQRRPGAGPVSSHSGAGWHQSIVPLLSALSIYIFSVNRAIFTICYFDEEAFK